MLYAHPVFIASPIISGSMTLTSQVQLTFLSKSTATESTNLTDDHISASYTQNSITTQDYESPSFAFLGTWSDTTISSAATFKWINITTGRVPDVPAETSGAILHGELLISLKPNRKWLTDDKLKSQYVEEVKKTREETVALIDKLNIKHPHISDCSRTKRKRSQITERQLRALIVDRGILSTITNAVKAAIADIGKILSCAGDVIKNVLDVVENITPDLNVIENLTDTLAEIGESLEEKNDTKSTTTEGSPSSTSTDSSTSSTSSGTSSQTFIDFQVLAKTYPVHRRAEVTSHSCSTTCSIYTDGCIPTATTSTTALESTNKPDFRCSPDNPKCAPNVLDALPGRRTSCGDYLKDDADHYSTRNTKNTLLHPSGYREHDIFDITKRWLLGPQDFKNDVWVFMENKLTSATFVAHGQQSSGPFSINSSVVLERELGNERVNLGITNLYGCTVVLVTSQKGVWLSQFWQYPSFVGDEAHYRFEYEVLNTLDAGCAFDQAKKGYGSGIRCQTGPGGLFADPIDPEVVVITPRLRILSAPEGDTEYPVEIEQIKSKTREIILNIPEPKVVGTARTIKSTVLKHIHSQSLGEQNYDSIGYHQTAV
ncbi:hypothetical protein HYALB_00010089 [Hymenoscyphus albidus]|uniref:Uncharacterized protein n=1 Tax=Hymenoscyphus albidus TaxID=595503 RepID=A0A9N9LEY3_9HELO|nr:hypothetical protein HYALB_00010089 [Hymenoscyphus albidus]